MYPRQLILRCLASKEDGQWVTFCLDFDLATQADTLEEAKRKLEAQIKEYVYDALAGEDQEFAEQLLSRRAPWHLWLRYYWTKFWSGVRPRKNGLLFNEHMPLQPSHNQFA
ncbi:MAG: type II toxin-antitoxin system HicB family antitoxin [Pseudomonadota bacterium]